MLEAPLHEEKAAQKKPNPIHMECNEATSFNEVASLYSEFRSLGFKTASHEQQVTAHLQLTGFGTPLVWI